MSFARTSGAVLLTALASAHTFAADPNQVEADAFATRHAERCMLRHDNPAMCAMLTVQLASHLYGMAFADQVAQALR